MSEYKCSLHMHTSQYLNTKIYDMNIKISEHIPIVTCS